MSTRNRALIVVAAIIVTVSAAVTAAAAVVAVVDLSAEARARDDHNRQVEAARERLLDSMSDDCYGSRVNSAPQQTVCMLDYIATLQAIQFAP